jgi:sensor histidine kinase YesM
LGFQNSLHTFFSGFEKSITKHKLYHVLFWLLYTALTASVIRIGNSWIDSFQRQLPIVATHALVVYVNLYLLLPKLLLVRNYVTYIFSVLLLIAGATFPLAILTHRLVAQEVIQDEVWSSFFLFLIAVGLFFSLILSMTLKFLKEWYQDQQSKRELKQVQLQTELMYLKAQINPHFLFNSLNNLYALTLMKSDLAPQIVLRLSDILRYVLYEASAGKVDIQKEIQHLHDFIMLEKLRLGDRITVNLDLEEPQYNYTIEPMLYLTLVENAFKHGAQSEISQGWVNIKGRTIKDGYALLVENSTAPKVSVNKAGGIGLSNLRKRLDLIYQGKYQLDIVQDDSQYSVSLILTLSHA